MRPRRPALLLGAVVFSLATTVSSAARAQLLLGPAMEMDAPVISPAPFYQWVPSMASDGTNFLVALNTSEYDGPAFSRYALVRADGTLAAPPPLLPNAASASISAVAFNGTTYAAVSQTSDAIGPLVELTRIGTDGAILDDPAIDAVRVPASMSNLRLAATSTTWLLAWEQYPAIGLARVGADGVVRDTAPTVLAPSAYRLRNVALGAHADGALLAYEQSRTSPFDSAPEGIAVRPLDRDGNLLGTTGTIVLPPREGIQTMVAYSSGVYLVASATTHGIEAVRVDTAGNALDTTPLSIVTLTSDPEYSANAAVVAQSDGWLVAWTTVSGSDMAHVGVHAARVSSTGAVLDPTPRSLGGAYVSNVGSFAWNGSTTLVARNEFGEAGPHAVVYRLSSALAPLDTPSTLASAPNGENFVSLSSGSPDVLAGWFDGRLGSRGALAFQRLESDGTPRTTPAHVVATNSDSLVKNLAIASSGSSYLATWSEADSTANVDHLRAIRLDIDGVPLDAAPTTLHDCVLDGYYGCDRASVTFDGTDFVLAIGLRIRWWGDVLVWRVALDGTTRQVTLPNTTGADGWGVSLGSNGEGSVLVMNYASTLSFQRMARDGSVIDSMPRPFNPVSFVHSGQSRVLAHGSEYTVFAAASQLLTFRLGPDGTVLGPSTVIPQPPGARVFAVTDTGTNFLVTWDYSRGFYETTAALRVGYDGAAIDPSPVDVLPDSLQRRWSSAAGLASGGTVLAYHAFDPRPEVLAPRVVVHVLSTRVDGGMDGGGVDSGEVDAAEPDAGDDAIEMDALVVDDMGVDASGAEAGVVDEASEVDAGETVDTDAGELDAGELDAGELDAPGGKDASILDVAIDAGAVTDVVSEASVDAARGDAPPADSAHEGGTSDVVHASDVAAVDATGADAASGGDDGPAHDAGCRCDLRGSRGRSQSPAAWWAIVVMVAIVRRRRPLSPR